MDDIKVGDKVTTLWGDNAGIVVRIIDKNGLRAVTVRHAYSDQSGMYYASENYFLNEILKVDTSTAE